MVHHGRGMIGLRYYWWSSWAILTRCRTPVLTRPCASPKQTLGCTHSGCVTADKVTVITSLHQQVLMILIVHVGVLGAALWLHSLGQASKIKLVSISFPMHLGHDILVVVIAQGSAKFVVIHIRFTLTFAPSSSNLIWIDEFEFSVGSFPCDGRRVSAVGEKLQQKLPKLYLTAA